MRIPFDAKVEGFKLKLYDQETFDKHLRTFEGKGVQLTIERGNTRSTQQNRWLWGVAYKVLADHTGHNQWEIHEFCKKRFNPKIVEIVNKQSGEIDSEMIGGSTTDMTTVEFMDYKEQLQEFGSSIGCYIADPNEDVPVDAG